jgi:hypothetical protein
MLYKYQHGAACVDVRLAAAAWQWMTFHSRNRRSDSCRAIRLYVEWRCVYKGREPPRANLCMIPLFCRGDQSKQNRIRS